jgi:hypothetical protein
MKLQKLTCHNFRGKTVMPALLLSKRLFISSLSANNPAQERPHGNP